MVVVGIICMHTDIPVQLHIYAECASAFIYIMYVCMHACRHAGECVHAMTFIDRTSCR